MLSELRMSDIFTGAAKLSCIANGWAVSSVCSPQTLCCIKTPTLYCALPSLILTVLDLRGTLGATLDVEEAGATAAAATGIDIYEMAFVKTPVLKLNLYGSHHCLHHKGHDFIGKIINPNI